MEAICKNSKVVFRTLKNISINDRKRDGHREPLKTRLHCFGRTVENDGNLKRLSDCA